MCEKSPNHGLLVGLVEDVERSRERRFRRVLKVLPFLKEVRQRQKMAVSSPLTLAHNSHLHVLVKADILLTSSDVVSQVEGISSKSRALLNKNRKGGKRGWVSECRSLEGASVECLTEPSLRIRQELPPPPGRVARKLDSYYSREWNTTITVPEKTQVQAG